MGAKLRARRSGLSRQIRRWAAPVVFTFALAPAGCSKDKHIDEKTSNPPDVRDPIDAQPSQAPIQSGNLNPPPPPIVPDAGAAKKVATASHLGTIARETNKACMFSVDSGCSENEKCNPPPPRDVDCGDLPNADVRGDVFRNADGTCYWQQETRCPPNAPCNPPAPSNVPCP